MRLELRSRDSNSYTYYNFTGYARHADLLLYLKLNTVYISFGRKGPYTQEYRYRRLTLLL